MITAIILTKNAQDTIKKCLESVSFCTHVVIIDDFSTDKTLAIARKSITRVLIYKRHSHSDFAAQRNYGLTKSPTDWVLFVDADEIISPPLQQEIRSTLQQSTNIQGFYLRRLDYFMNSPLKYGETGSIKLLRLARKQSGQWHRPVHETWLVSGQIGTLKHSIIHYPHSNIGAFLNKINYYTNIEALYRRSQNQSFNLIQLFAFPPLKFFNNYILKQGYRDRFPGFVMAFLMSLHSLLVRIKLYENHS